MEKDAITWGINSPNFNFYPNAPAPGQEVGIITSPGGPIVPLTPPVTVISPSSNSSVKFSSNVTILEGQSSAMLHTFAIANASVYVPAEVNNLSEGDEVEVILLPV